jgi:outer membrane protein assembly factor BamB
VWRLDVPGKLVHIEGGPTLSGGRAYVGAGQAGVLCVEMNRVTVDGKEQSLAESQTLSEQRWKLLVARYEEDKKKDPDFAIPPSEDALPRVSPMVAWQQGQGRWHVDAPLAVVGDRVLVASGYLDQEQTGDRALYCLSAVDGKQLWRTPLALNPWAGASVAGDVVLIGLSSIRFDPQTVAGAQGQVMAVSLADGSTRWSKVFPGGVLSPVSVQGNRALVTASDGQLRSLDVATGEEKWAYSARSPLFAGMAIAGEVAYTADLKGTVHAVNLADGKPLWTLDLGAEPVKAAGMVYGSPTLSGGRLYLATCNFGLPGLSPETVLVCIGEK